MKRKLWLLFLFGFLFMLNRQALAEKPTFDELGHGVSETVESFGDPLKITPEDGFLVYWYESRINPEKATLLFVIDQQVVVVSEGIARKKFSLNFYLTQYGQPDQSILVADSGSSLDTIHVWEDDRLAVLATGSSATDLVKKQEKFLDLDTYWRRWKIAPTTSASNPISLPTPTPYQAPQQSNGWRDLPNQPLVLLGFVIASTFLGGLLAVIHIRKRRRHNDTQLSLDVSGREADQSPPGQPDTEL